MSTSREAIKDYQNKVEKMSDEDIDKKFSDAHQYNKLLAEDVFDEELSKSLNGDNDIMCYVDIPSLGIYLPVYYGTSNDVLKKGCGWLEKTSLPVGGKDTHSVISGHTGLPNAEMFTKLDSIKNGAIFYIHVYDQVFAYRVFSIESVNPSRTELLLIDKGKDCVTLLTCTPYGINDKRLLVKGERVDLSELNKEEAVYDEEGHPLREDEADIGLSDQITQQFLIVALISGVSILLFAGACIWLKFAVGRKAVRGKYERRIKRPEDDNAEETKKEE